MPLILRGRPTSSCTRRALLALVEKDVEDFTLEYVEFATKEHKKPDFLKKQPFGQIPVLEDDDFSLFESRAIVRYICEKYPSQGSDLLGSTLQERGLVNQWCEVESHNFNPSVGGILKEVVIGPRFGLIPNMEKVGEHLDKAKLILDVYEKHLSEGHEYLVGNKFTIADLFHIPYLAMLWPAKYAFLITERKHVLAWWDRISARDSWKQISTMQ